MLNIVLPKYRFKKGTLDAANFVYPSLDDRFDGALVPIRIGDIHNIIPVCIDTAVQIYMICGHAIHAVTEVRDAKEGTVLALNIDYTLNAGKNEISLFTTPFLAANTTYYFVVEGTGFSGADYLKFRHHNPYADGIGYTIDDASPANWAVTGNNLRFRIYGTQTIGGTEELMVDNWAELTWPGETFFRSNLSVNTRIAQSFTTPATPVGGFYVSWIWWESTPGGSPTGSVQATILDIAGPPVGGGEHQIGVKSNEVDIIPGDDWGPRIITFPQSAANNGVVVDIEGAEEVGGAVPITTVAEALKYLTQTVLGKPSTLLDATYLTDLAIRTQTVKLNLDYETTAEAIIGTLETGQLWKLVPLLDGTYGTVVYDDVEPANTPHFRDEDYLSFRMWQDYGAVKSKVIVKYDKGAGEAQEYKTEQASSDLAHFFYLNEETLEVETMLQASAGATWLAGEVGGMYEQPLLMVEFEVHGYGMDLIPGRDKVKLTRTRAMYASGTLNAMLFRILRLCKRPGTSTVVITAILDTQSY